MHRGYTRRYRKRWDKGTHKDHLLWVLMDYLIDHANYKDTKIFFPNIGEIPIKRGEHIFSVVKIADKLGVGRQRIRTKLKILEKIQFLTMEPTNLYTKIYIINYDIYQGNQPEANQATNQDLTKSQPSPNQVLTIDKKDNNIKKVKNKKVQQPAVGIFSNYTIDEKITLLVETAIFPKADIFVKSQLKKNKNESALNHTLNQLYRKAKNNGHHGNFDAWAYCNYILKVESGNYNERDSVAEAQRQKNALRDMINEIGG